MIFLSLFFLGCPMFMMRPFSNGICDNAIACWRMIKIMKIERSEKEIRRVSRFAKKRKMNGLEFIGKIMTKY